MDQAPLLGLADRAQQEPGGVRTWTLGRLLRDPLLHFLLLGGILFLAGLAWQRAHDPRRIIVDTFALERLAVEYRQRFGVSPSPQALRGVIDDYVAEEVLYREGLARGVDRDDEIIRRRVIQKMRFLEENRSVNPVPDDTVLRAYYARHRGHYAGAAGVSFSHIYFSADTGNALARAEQARASLERGGGSEDLGDAFPDRSTFANLSETDAERVFGKSEFSHALFTLKPGTWSRPLTSGFGIHLVRIDRRFAPSVPPFDAIRSRVLADWTRDDQDARNQKALQALVKRYTIVFPDGKNLR